MYIYKYTYTHTQNVCVRFFSITSQLTGNWKSLKVLKIILLIFMLTYKVSVVYGISLPKYTTFDKLCKVKIPE